MEKRILNNDGIVILSSIDEICFGCIKSNCINGYSNQVCIKDGGKKRLGIAKTNHGTVYVCSNDSKTTKNFKNELNTLASGIKFFESTKKEIITATIEDEHKRVSRLIHNLKSLNAHIIQEVYSVVPQDLLTANISKTLEKVEDAIKENIRDAAIALLRIAKFNTGVKAEFSVYDKILKNDVQLNPSDVNIRNVLMLVLHMFFTDFADKHVYVDVANYYEKAFMDFESVFVAFYHIIENSTKYVCPNTKIEVDFQLDGDMHKVTFSMRSLYIYPDDEERIFEDGYSGILAKKIGKAGHGLGMYRAKQLLLINNSTIDFIPGSVEYDSGGVTYADNQIVVRIPVVR